MTSVRAAMDEQSTTPADAEHPTGPRRWGLFFAGIWLFYLLSPADFFAIIYI